ncbi:MAG TPA: UDP-N-acetylglucosamine 2-epimerase, partial [Euzebyales bacterium]|nr:UDP-N-acetylglucosamine 2-epimerase [Euzebyales bacterium]
ALCVAGAAEAYARLQPDLLVILGDRYEALALAQAAMIADIPIAHIGGGESTDGVSDEAIRHSITKMAHLHFVAAEEFRRRVIQLGEDPYRVWTVGALGLDTLARLRLLERDALAAEIDLDPGSPLILLTYPPTPRAELDPDAAITVVLKALDAFPDGSVIATPPNVDAGGAAVTAALEAYAAAHPGRVRMVGSLGQLRYLSVLRHADVVVGNSSSGLIEAPALRTPTVNIGIRQHGRLRASSVIDCPEDVDAIVGAIRTALSDSFRHDVTSPYGDGRAVPRITAVITDPRLDLRALLTKPFVDLPAAAAADHTLSVQP